jgi:hypothetical protein
MKIRSNGLPPYLDQLDEMFAGNTVDGSSSYVPAAGPTTQVHEVSSDDEGQDDEDTRTPMSLGTKRTGSTSTTATSPNKKTKNTYARVMNQHMNSHLELARERLEVHKNALQKKAHDKDAARTAVNWKIAECSRIAEHELGISRDTPALLDGLLALAENEAQMDLFLSSSETVRIRIIQKLANNPPPVDP